MSYCRFSDEDFRCDVYVYESACGYETHVAARRRVLREDMLPPPLPDSASPEQQVARHMRVMEIVDSAEVQEIDLPEAGESFLHATPGECADNLERLRAAGFRVPQYAIAALRAEAAG
jgi:hypothetical protein